MANCTHTLFHYVKTNNKILVRDNSLHYSKPGLLATLHTIYAFDIASHVPLSPGGEITYGELAERCGLPEDDTRRVVQTASTFRIFEEASPDLTVRHNAVSAVFASPGINAVLGLLLEENWPAAAKFVDSLKRFPGSGEPGHSAQMVALRAADAAAGNTTSRDEIEDTSKGLFDHISKDEKRVARFRTAMGVSHSTPGFSTLHFVNNLPWADKDQCPQTVIDVGGAGGELSELSTSPPPSLLFHDYRANSRSTDSV